MTATEKLAHKRLTLLQLAEKLGNVSKVCRMHRVRYTDNSFLFRHCFLEVVLTCLMTLVE